MTTPGGRVHVEDGREVAVKVRILGPLEVEDELGRVVELGSPKQQALLALLVIHANQVLSTDRIIDELWGEQPPSDGARNVRVYVSRLREVLEPDRATRAPGRLIVTEPSGYALRIDPESIDAHRFERLVDEARGEMADHPDSVRKEIAEALSLWRDRPLAGLAFEEFAQSEIRRLEELHLSALELGYEASIRVGEHSSTIPDLEKLVAEHPLRERLVALLMEAMAGSGRQAEALRAYRSLELRLADEIGLEPSVELRLLEERILLQQEQRSDEPSLLAPEAEETVDNLPARATSFVGREADLDEVARLLEGTRLLTLTGPGGVGKTSLAIEAGRSAAAQYSDRVRLVDFAPLGGSTGVTAAVADALNVKDEAGMPLESVIAAALRLEPSLLLFDNCEHVLDTVSFLVVELLQAVPELTIVCTSRRSLGVDGESVYEVAPLRLPPVGADVDELRAIASSRLLSDRAVAVSPHFKLTIENAADVAALCQRLDGIPLAIELAASNLRSMTTREVVESLEDRLSLGGRRHGVRRHRALRDTMQWSYDLLEETEQAVFDRLSVFAGRFSREAALAIGADRSGVPPSVELTALVDASMIVADVSGRSTKYRILPTLRDFGVFNLREDGELESVRLAHAEYLTADAKDMVLPYAQNQPTRRVEQNASVEDFRAAAEWALDAGRPELAPTLVVALNHHSISGRRLDEAADWIRRVTEFAVEGSFELWQLEMTAAIIDYFTGRSEAAEAAFRSLSASAAEMGETAASADALRFVGHALWRDGDLRGARDAMATAAEAGSASDWSSLSKREVLAMIELQLGNILAAEQQADILATFADRTHDPVATAAEIHIRGWVTYYQGELEKSIQLFELSRDIALEEGDDRLEFLTRQSLARVFATLGLPDQALAQAQVVYDRTLLSRQSQYQSQYEGQSLILIGGAQLDLGDLRRAARSVAGGLKILQDRHPSVDHMARGLRFGGWIALAHGHSDLAVRFQIAAEAEFQRIGLVAPPAEAAHAAHALAEARQLLGEAEQDTPTNRAEHAPFATVLNEAIGYLQEVAEGPG